MKNFALLVAIVLLALAAPMSAAEVSTVAPATTLEQQTEGPPLPLFMIIPFCSAVNGTSCPTLGATKRCTDVCGSQLSCTCITISGAKYWYCQQEC